MTTCRLALPASCAMPAAGCATPPQGAQVALARAGAFFTVEDAMVQPPDIQAANGIVRTGDRVPMPPRR